MRCDTGGSGYISGKKNLKVPWTELALNPSAWIEPECYPSEFIWGDPSKITLDPSLELLDHWTKRRVDGLPPLIWNLACELLVNTDHHVEHVRNLPRTRAGRSRLSERNVDDDDEEEDFTAEMRKLIDAFPESSSPSPSPSPSLPIHTGMGRASSPGGYIASERVLLLF
jgi:hypothetical protein